MSAGGRPEDFLGLERRQARIGGVGALRIIGDTEVQTRAAERRIGVADARRIILLSNDEVDGRVKKELCVKRPLLLRLVAHGDCDRRCEIAARAIAADDRGPIVTAKGSAIGGNPAGGCQAVIVAGGEGMLGGEPIAACHDHHREIPAQPADRVIDRVEVAQRPAATMDIVQRAPRLGRRPVNPERNKGVSRFKLPLFDRGNLYAAARPDNHRDHCGRLCT